MEHEYKTVGFKVTNLDFDGRTVEGYAAVFGNIDLGGDIIHRGAFAKTLVERGSKVRFLWQHDSAEPLGKPLEMREDEQGLYIKAIISDTARGRDALALLRDNAINGMSIGYDAIPGGTDYSKAEDTGEGVRNLREVRLWEFSLVTFPMNESAQVTALKTVTPFQDFPLAPRDHPWDAPAAEGRVRTWAGAEEAPNAKYARAFFWHDAENAENFTSYKFPYVDIIEGNASAVFRAVANGAARLEGSTLSDADKNGVKAQMARYYDKAASAYDDDTIAAPWKAAPAPDESKVGRVISKANEARLMRALENAHSAISDIEEILDAAGITLEDEPAPAEEPGRDEDMSDADKAGPPQAPTSEDADALELERTEILKQIESFTEV
jgi:HK97 family phage prohead protease